MLRAQPFLQFDGFLVSLLCELYGVEDDLIRHFIGLSLNHDRSIFSAGYYEVQRAFD